MPNVIDAIVIQVTDKSQGATEERVIVQQYEDVDTGVLQKEAMITYANLPAPEQAAYDTLKAYLQTQIDLQ